MMDSFTFFKSLNVSLDYFLPFLFSTSVFLSPSLYIGLLKVTLSWPYGALDLLTVP